MKEIPDEYIINLQQFIEFLEISGRSGACPVCPHQGNWNFIVDDTKGAGRDSLMYISCPEEVSPGGLGKPQFSPSYSMECPNCGYMVHTSAQVVSKVLADRKLNNG